MPEPTFSFAALARRDASLCAHVRGLTAQIRALWGGANKSLVEIGKALLEVKAALPHGEWLGWLERELHLHERSAERLMSLGRRFGHTATQELEGLSATALYQLAAPSTPVEVVAEVQREAAAGEPPSATEVEERIRAAKPVKPSDASGSTKPARTARSKAQPEKATPAPSGEPGVGKFAPVQGEIPRIRGLVAEVRAVRTAVNALRSEYDERPEMGLAAAGLAYVSEDLANALSLIKRQVMPVGLCPHCSGEGCPRCGGAGWATESFIGEIGGEVERWTP